MIPIQINQTPRASCGGYSGYLNSWEYGLKQEYKEKLMKEYMNMAKLAQFDTVNSPYYTQVKPDPEYIKFLQDISKCNLRNK